MITKFDATWAGSTPAVKAFQLKKEVGQLNPGEKAVRIAFRFCVAYVVMDREGKILLKDGQWLPTADFHLNGFGRVVGPCDLSAADGTKMQEAWRAAYFDKCMDRFAQGKAGER